jgi:uncharacterized membrane protein (Fun14 family)
MNDLFVMLGLEIGTGALSGFALGFGLKKIARILFTALSIVAVLFLLPMFWLAHMGVVTVNFPKLLTILEQGATWAASGLSSALGQWSLLGGSTLGTSFGIGLALGLKKG